MTDGEVNDTAATETPALPESLSLVDMIADFPQGEEVLDLSVLLASVPAGVEPASVEPNAGAGHEPPPSPADLSGSVDATVDLAFVTATGAGSVLSILYDDTKPVHQETVT